MTDHKPEPRDAAAAYEAWVWPRFLRALDEAGYAVIKKPDLRHVGKTKPRPHV
jgi:hypothetical protein